MGELSSFLLPETAEALDSSRAKYLADHVPARTWGVGTEDAEVDFASIGGNNPNVAAVRTPICPWSGKNSNPLAANLGCSLSGDRCNRARCWASLTWYHHRIGG